MKSNKNIVKDFIRYFILTIVILSIVSAILISHIQKDKTYRDISKNIVVKTQQNIFYTIVIIIITIIIFSLFIFPLIYYAYRQLEKNRIQLIQKNISIVSTLGNAIALRDSTTNEHNYRVTIYAITFAKELHLDDTQIKKLIIGAFLHDVGKIGISDSILLKDSKLTNNESGYPNKLKGENIPLIARIFTIVDVFDALTSKRPYKEIFSFSFHFYSINFFIKIDILK